MAFFKSRIAVAVIGLILIGGVSAAIAVATSPQPFRTALAETGTTGATPTATNAPATTATSAPVIVATTAPAPTATTAAQPTARPTATPLVIVAGQSVHIPSSGKVVKVNTGANSFVVRYNGVNYTIDVNDSTSYSGSATNFNALRVGMQAEVQGTGQADGSVLATEVNANADN